jgi:hypothetical protein
MGKLSPTASRKIGAVKPLDRSEARARRRCGEGRDLRFPANACALGASYGGYMMNWIAGVWPDGFKCLVQHDGVFDARAMAYETEELWFDEREHGGPLL